MIVQKSMPLGPAELPIGMSDEKSAQWRARAVLVGDQATECLVPPFY